MEGSKSDKNIVRIYDLIEPFWGSDIPVLIEAGGIDFSQEHFTRVT